MAITLNTTGGGVVIRTSSQRWFNALGSSHIDTIKIYQTESGQTSSTLLKSFNVNITNSTQLIQIKIPNEDISLRIKSLEIVVEDKKMEKHIHETDPSLTLSFLEVECI